MSSQIALLICLLFMAFGLRQDIRESPRLSRATWIPFLWIAFSASKPLSLWMNPQLATQITVWAGPSNIDYSAGSPIDRNFLFALMLMGLVILYQRRRHFSLDLRKNFWLSLFFFFMLTSASWSHFPALTAKRWIRTVGDLIMVLIIHTEDDEREAFIRILRRCAIVLMPLSLVFIKYFMPIGVSRGPYGEMMNVGVTTQKNHLGALCAFSGILFLWQLLKKLPRINYLDAVLLFLATYLLYLSRSATSIIIFIVGSLVLIFEMVIKINKKYHKRAVIALILSMILIQVFMTDFLGDSLASRFFSATGRDMTFTGRVPFWGDLIEIGRQRPILGAGYGGFWFSNMSIGLWAKYEWRPVSGHNGYIDLFIDLGLVGLAIFLMVLINVYKMVVNSGDVFKEADYLYFAYLLMIILHNITESSFAKSVSFLWIIFLFLAAVVDKRQTDKNVQCPEETAVVRY